MLANTFLTKRNSMATKIFIDKEGNIHGLSSDLMDGLSFLGPKTVARVSNIIFDHAGQEWVACAVSGAIIARHPIRSRVVALEREYFDKQLEETFAETASN